MTEIVASKEEIKKALEEIERGLEQVGREIKHIARDSRKQMRTIEALESDLRRAGLLRK
jgi:methyl-accepting chemotaxis protein